MTQEIRINYHPTGLADPRPAAKVMRVEPSYSKDGDAFLGLDTDNAYAYLPPTEARKLGEWFATRYGVGGYLGAKAGETVKVVDKDGKLERTVEVTGALDGDGEYPIRGGGWVPGAFVRHADAILPETAPEFAEGTPVIITSADATNGLGVRLRVPAGTPAVVVEKTDLDTYRVRLTRDGRLITHAVKPEFLSTTAPASEVF